MVMAVRGAIKVAENSSDSIKKSVKKLIESVARENAFAEDDVISMIFSLTKDITALNPATALRETGFANVALFCTQEPEYSGSVPGIIRVIVTLNVDQKRKAVPVYLDGAETLRTDLFQKK
jgi:chorismate mutase